MKTYKYNKNNTKWYKKINWIRTIIIFVLVGGLSFLVFDLLGKNKDISRALRTACIISVLITGETVLTDLLENKKRIFWTEKKDLFYIEIHDQKDGKYLSDKEFDEITKDKDVKEIHNNLEEYEGIDCGKIQEVISIKKRFNNMVIKANVIAKEWVPVGKITVKKLSLEEKKYKKKIIIPSSFDNYEELYKIFNNKLIK